MNRCVDCAYYRPADVEDGPPRRGTCQRFPPQIIDNEFGQGAQWPEVERDDVCGEFSWHQVSFPLFNRHDLV